MDVKTETTEKFHRMPYSELKKMAKEHGIKGNMKAEKIISALSSLVSEDIESFSTPAQKKINSSKKNKEQKLDDDHMTPIFTPRRGTYSIESPSSVSWSEPWKVDDHMTPVFTPRRGTFSIESPSSLQVTDTPVSSKKVDIPSASTDFDTSFNTSNITIARGSERKLRSRKVSFMSPVNTPSTPKNSNIRLRAKTPIASRTPLAKRVSFSSPDRQGKRRSSEKPLRSTPHPRTSARRRSAINKDCSKKNVASEVGLSSNIELFDIQEDGKPFDKESSEKDSQSSLNSDVPQKNVAPEVPPPPTTELLKTEEVIKPIDKQLSKDEEQSSSAKFPILKANKTVKTKQVETPSSVKFPVSKTGESAKIRRLATPNFKKIHEKAFEKMESIDDYQKRKELNSAKKIDQRPVLKTKVTKTKSKIPSYSGIPFIPSAPATVFTAVTHKSKEVIPANKKIFSAEIKSAVKENASERRKVKFDLKASLSRRLGYKPHKGPLKPLNTSTLSLANAESTLNVSCFHNSIEPVKTVVGANRIKTRSMLKGVRTNKRFELQMKNRKLD